MPLSFDGGTVGIVVTTYNHAHFLLDALASVFNQVRPADRVIVVDDGSSDDPATVLRSFPEATLIRQDNQGLAAARNAGLLAVDTDYVIFLDADDRVDPCAIEAALACFARAPECGFVYGGHRYVNRDGEPIGQRYEPPGEDPYEQLLRGNFIAMHGTVMYRRDRLVSAGGFDRTLPRCEDYDVYLRMAQRYPIAGYADLVADYRLHGENMSTDYVAMVTSALHVHSRHRPGAHAEARVRRAWRHGRRAWRNYYATEMASMRYRSRQAGASLVGSLPGFARLAAVSPGVAWRETFRGVKHRAARLLPQRLRDRMLGDMPGIGRIRFGDLGGTEPISRDFGFERGTPIDRYYIERFLERHASEIVGRVLEIGGNDYTRRFGGARVTRSDILHVHRATRGRPSSETSPTHWCCPSARSTASC